jgi:NHS family xanthosine MFS transporter
MMMTNGFGAIIGSLTSGYLIEHYFTLSNGKNDWSSIWLAFALYALVIAVLFAVLFKHKHEPEKMNELRH